MIKAAFFDFDGTLVGTDYSGLSTSTRVALAGLRARGVSLWLSTGRPLYEVPGYVTGEIEGVGKLDGYLCNSGSWCVDATDVFHSATLDPKDVETIVAAVARGEFDVVVLMPDHELASQRSARVRKLEGLVDLEYPEGPIEDVIGQPILQMCAFVERSVDAEIEEMCEHVICYRWSELFCDVVPDTSGKDKGVLATLDHLSISPAEAIAFGDGGNDVPMMRVCGESVAMGNGTSEAKAQATFVTDTADDDGIYKACVALGLIDDTLGLC